MGTSDGVRTDDWDLVHALAVEIVNASDPKRAEYRQQLLLYLERLEEKYGPLPSILATRADYLESGDAERETLLLSAHSAAESDGDVVNLLCSAQSVVELFLEWRRLSDADLWLRRLREYLDRYGENHVKYSDYENLRAEYRKLAISPVNSSEQ